jgi:hypothetical protein
VTLTTNETRDAPSRPVTDQDGRRVVRPGYPAPVANVGGQVVAPAGAAVIADTGQLPAGDYMVEIEAGAADTLAAGKGLRVEHRNAANTANVRQGAIVPAGSSVFIQWSRVAVALNERIRVTVASVAGTASSEYGAAIRVYPL